MQRLDPSLLTQALDLAISGLEFSSASLEGVRIALERQAAIEAAQRHDEVGLADLAKSLGIITHTSSNDLLDQADYEFHYGLMKASGNEVLIFFAAALSGVLRPLLADRRAAMRKFETDRRDMIDTHSAIYLAVAAGSPVAAAAAVDDHFERFRELMSRIPEFGDGTQLPPPKRITTRKSNGPRELRANARQLRSAGSNS